MTHRVISQINFSKFIFAFDVDVWTWSQAPAILSFQIGNDKCIKKNSKFIVSLGQYKENDTEKMVDTVQLVDQVDL